MLRNEILIAFLGLGCLTTLPAHALDLSEYAVPAQSSMSYFPPETQALMTDAWHSAATLSPAVAFLKIFRVTAPSKSDQLLKQTPVEVQEQALREVLLEWTLYSEHEWPDLSEQTASLAKRLEGASPITKNTYQRFQFFLKEPETFSSSSDPFEQLLWNTHKSIEAFHLINIDDLEAHTSQVLDLGNQLSLSSALMEAKLLQVLSTMQVINFSFLVANSRSDYSLLADKFLTEKDLKDLNETGLQPELLKIVNLNLQALKSAQETSSDFLALRSFIYFNFFFDGMASNRFNWNELQNQLSPWFINDLSLLLYTGSFGWPSHSLTLEEKLPEKGPVSERRSQFTQLMLGLKNANQSEGRSQLLKSLKYYESQPPGLVPMIIHFLLGKVLVEKESFNLGLAEEQFQHALTWADKAHRPQFKAIIYHELARMEERQRQSPETALAFISKALGLVKGEPRFKFELLQMKAELLVKLKQETQAIQIYRQLLPIPDFHQSAMSELYVLKDPEFLRHLPDEFKAADTKGRVEILRFILEAEKQSNSYDSPKMSQDTQTLLKSLVQIVSPSEAHELGYVYQEIVEKLGLQEELSSIIRPTDLFSLDTITVEWLKSHPDIRYVPRLIQLLQAEAWSYEHRRAWQVLKKSDPKSAITIMRHFLVTYPEAVVPKDLLDFWNLKEDLSPQLWWSLYPRLQIDTEFVKDALDQRILPWLSQTPSEAFAYLKPKTEDSTRTKVLDLIFKAFPPVMAVKLFEGYLNSLPVEQQEPFLYTSKGLKIPELALLYKHKLPNTRLRGIALESLADFLEEPEVYPYLLNALKDDKLWNAAISAIRQSKNKRFIPLLKSLLTQQDDLKSDDALMALIELGADGLEIPIRQSLSREDLGQKRSLFWALRNAGSERLIVNIALPFILANGSPWRKDAINALGKIHSRDIALEILMKVPEQPEILQLLAPTLIQALKPQDLPMLLQTMRKVSLNSQWPAIKQMLLMPRWSTEGLHSYLISIFSQLSDEQQVEVLTAFGQYASPVHAPFILSLLKNPSGNIQVQALKALQDMRYLGDDDRIKAFYNNESATLVDLAHSLEPHAKQTKSQEAYQLTKELDRECSTDKLLTWIKQLEDLKSEQRVYLRELLFEKKSSSCQKPIIELYWSNRLSVVSEDKLLEWMQESKDPRFKNYFSSLSLDEFAESVRFGGGVFNMIDEQRIKEALPLIQKALNFTNPSLPETEIDESGMAELPAISGEIEKDGFGNLEIRNLLVVLSKIDSALYLDYVHRMLSSLDQVKRHGAAQAIVEVGSSSLIPELKRAIQRNDMAVIEGLISELSSDDEADRKDALEFRELALELANAQLIKTNPDILYVLAVYHEPGLAAKIRPYLNSPSQDKAKTAWRAYVTAMGAAVLPELHSQWQSKKMNSYQVLQLLAKVPDSKALEFVEEILKDEPSERLLETVLIVIQRIGSLSPGLLKYIALQWQTSTQEDNRDLKIQIEESFLSLKFDPEKLEREISQNIPAEELQLLKIRLYLIRHDNAQALKLARTLLRNPKSSLVTRFFALKNTWQDLAPEERLPLLEEIVPLIQSQFSAYQYYQAEKPLEQIYDWLSKTHEQLGHEKEARDYQFLTLLELGRSQAYMN